MSPKIEVKVFKCDPDAEIPEYQTEGAAGFDLISITTESIDPGEVAQLHTGLVIIPPLGYELQVRSRGGMAYRGLSVANQPGTIDSDYRGEAIVLLLNTSNGVKKVSKGDRVAQGVLSKVPIAKFKEIYILDDTERGEGRLGSTG